MNTILNIFIKIITPETISSVIARLISKLLSTASKKGGTQWDVSKKVVTKIRIWIDLFDEVYSDDEMSKEEEEMISQAIKNQIDIPQAQNVLKKLS